jgi:hypothetical protein
MATKANKRATEESAAPAAAKKQKSTGTAIVPAKKASAPAAAPKKAAAPAPAPAAADKQIVSVTDVVVPGIPTLRLTVIRKGELTDDGREKTVRDFLGEAPRRVNYAKEYHVRKTLSDEAMATWKLEVKEVKDNTHMKRSLALVRPPLGGGNKTENVAFVGTFLVVSAVASGVGIRTHPSDPDTKRMYKARFATAIDEEILEDDPALAADIEFQLQQLPKALQRIQDLQWEHPEFCPGLKGQLRKETTQRLLRYKAADGKSKEEFAAMVDEEARQDFFKNCKWWCTTYKENPETGVRDKVINPVFISARRNTWTPLKDKKGNPISYDESAAGGSAADDDGATDLSEHIPVHKGGKKSIAASSSSSSAAGEASTGGKFDPDAIIRDPAKAYEIYGKLSKTHKYNRFNWRDHTGKPIESPAGKNDIMFQPVRQNDFVQQMLGFHLYVTGEPDDAANSKRGGWCTFDFRHSVLIKQGQRDARQEGAAIETAAARDFDPSLLEYNNNNNMAIGNGGAESEEEDTHLPSHVRAPLAITDTPMTEAGTAGGADGEEDEEDPFAPVQP